MPFWYNEPKDNEKFSSLARTDWKECNSTINFTELGIKESDDFYHLYMNATSVTDVIKVGAAKDWKFPGELTSLKIAKKDYVKQDYKTKKTVAVEQHRVEKLFCKLIATYDLTKVYSGFIFFQDAGIVDMLLSSTDVTGKSLPVEIIEQMSASYLSLEIVESPEYIKLDEIELPASKNNWSKGYSNGQTELTKLNDRLNFVLSQMKLRLPDEKIETIADIYELCSRVDSSEAGIAIAIWEYCNQLIK